MILSATLRRTGSRLFGHVDDAETTFTDLLQQLVATDLMSRSFGDRRLVLGEVQAAA